MRIVPIAAGVLGLASLELVVRSTQGGSGRFTGLLGGVASAVRWWLSPAVAAIPDRRLPAGSRWGASLAAPAPASSSSTPAPAYPSPSELAPTPSTSPRFGPQ